MFLHKPPVRICSASCIPCRSTCALLFHPVMEPEWPNFSNLLSAAVAATI
jgi:hypothetical protein